MKQMVRSITAVIFLALLLLTPAISAEAMQGNAIGEVSYFGWWYNDGCASAYDLYVWVSEAPGNDWNLIQPAQNYTVVGWPSCEPAVPYEISLPQGYNYYVKAFWDVIPNGLYDYGEPFSEYVYGPMTVVDNQNTYGSITIWDGPSPETINPTGTIDNGTPDFQWTSLFGAFGYTLFITEFPSGVPIIELNVDPIDAGCDTGQLYCVIPSPVQLGNGNYTWFVTALDANFGTPESFHMDFQVLMADPPAAPTLISPAGIWSDDLSPTYSWNAVAGATDYRLVVGTALDATFTAVQTGCPSGTGVCTVSPMHILTNGNTYSWTVTGINMAGPGTPSLPGSFTVQVLPAAPTLVSPSGTDVSTLPTYIWNAVSGATEYSMYRIYSGTSSTAIYSASQANCSGGTGQCSVTETTPYTIGTSVSWKVRATNIIGTGPWGTSMTFQVGSLPGAPTLIGPSGSGASTLPTFTWNAVAGATDYKIYRNVDGTSSTVTYTASQALCPGGTGQCSITETTPYAVGTSVSWNVSAVNQVGTGPWGTSMTFQVGSLPGTPTLVGPSGVTGILPTYTWNAVAGATDYRIYLAYNGTSSSVSYTAAQAHCPTGSGQCTVTETNPYAIGTSVSWLVRAVNQVGSSPWSSSMSFQVASLPAAPTLVGPTGSGASTLPSYTWNAVAGATDYRIYLEYNGTSSTATYTAAQANCAGGTGQCYVTETNPYAIATSVSWNVRAVNQIGEGPWGVSMAFQVGLLPAAPVIVDPLTGSVTSTLPTYTWNAVPGATDYRIYLAYSGTSKTVIYTAAAANCPSGSGECSVTETVPFALGIKVSWLVRAMNQVGTGPWSVSKTFTVTIP